MALTRTVAPSVRAVTAADLRTHLRIDDVAENGLLEAVSAAAEDWAETFLGRSLVAQTWRLTLDAFPSFDEAIELPKPPLVTVDSIAYVDTDGATQTIDAADYTVDTDTEPGRVFPVYAGSWPSTRDVRQAVTVTYSTGYGASGDDVPESIRSAVKLFAGHLYEHREATMAGQSPVVVPLGAQSLLWPHRLVGV